MTVFKHPGQSPEKKWNDPDVLNFIALSLAGICTEQRIDYDLWATETSGRPDIIEAMAFLVFKGWEGSNGKHWTQYDLDDFFFEFDKLVEVRHNIFDAGYWNCVSAIAERLIEKGELDGRECVEIILNNWHGELPEQVFPLEKHGENNKEDSEQC